MWLSSPPETGTIRRRLWWDEPATFRHHPHVENLHFDRPDARAGFPGLAPHRLHRRGTPAASARAGRRRTAASAARGEGNGGRGAACPAGERRDRHSRSAAAPAARSHRGARAPVRGARVDQGLLGVARRSPHLGRRSLGTAAASRCGLDRAALGTPGRRLRVRRRRLAVIASAAWGGQPIPPSGIAANHAAFRESAVTYENKLYGTRSRPALR